MLQSVHIELKQRSETLPWLEAESQALGSFVSSGEAARIKARLTQAGRYWEELGESVEQLIGRLEESSAHLQRFSTNLEQV